MLSLARRTVRHRLRTFISPFVALLMAVIVVSSAGVIVESGLRGGASPDRYAAADIVIAGHQEIVNPLQPDERVRLPERVRIPVSVADRAAQVPGVQAVVVDRAVPVTAAADGLMLVDEHRAIIGQGWASAALWPVHTIEGRAPQTYDEVALDSALAATGGVAVGDVIEVTSVNGTHPHTVVGLVEPISPTHRRHAGVWFADHAIEQMVVDSALADAIGVLLVEGADLDVVARGIREELGAEFAVHIGDARARPESLEVTLLNRELVDFGGAFGGTTAMLAVFIVAATLGFSILQRGREIALLRAVGATPGQVRRMIVGEAAIVAVVAGAVGAIPGLLLGAGLFRVLQSAGITAETTALRLGPLPVMVALATGMTAACIAAFFAARRAARIHPTAALSEAAIEPARIGWIRLLLGIVLLGSGLALSVLASTLEGEDGAAAVVGVLLLLIIGIAVVGPVLARAATWLGAPFINRRGRASGVLAVANLRLRARRLASASTPLALAVALSLTMVGSLSIEAAATEQQTRERLVADRVMRAPGGLPPVLAETVRGVPGVSTVVEVYPTSIGVARSELFGEQVFEMRPAVGLSAGNINAVLDLDVRAGSFDDLGHDELALSTELARSAGVGIGDELQVWLGDGTVRSHTVVGIYARSLGLGDFIVAGDLAIAHVTETMASELLVAYAAESDEPAIDTAIREAGSGIPGLVSLEAGDAHAAFTAAASESASINYLFVAVLVAFVTVAMVNTLVLATAERARELALLRLVGATRGQVLRMIRLEGLVIVGFGVLLGLAVAMATLVPFSLGIAHTPVPAMPLAFVAAVIAGALILGVAAAELPARLALRKEPLAVISSPL